MQIYLMRHGEAFSPSEDSKRPLMEEGKRQVALVSRFLKDHSSVSVNEVWHSTKLRARQTAEIFAKEFGLTVPVEEVGNLEPDDNPELIMEDLASLTQSILIVGHMPHLSYLTSLLVFGRADAGSFEFELASVAALSFEPGRGNPISSGKSWSLQWMLGPALLERVL
ncbi:MAG: phosphohistidine phosphatase SixA [Candidatus Omnitrophica bacterium]|nr:phosphohistidine phosphatase SixA [Candidatus Omnitrophota bacterium]